jgi:SOS-response transcriptional repressor LexA
MSGPRTKPGDPPTRRQYEIFRLIVRHLAEHAVPPTIQELTALAGVRGTFGLYTQVHALAAKGLITLGPRGKFRAIQVPAVAAAARGAARKLLAEYRPAWFAPSRPRPMKPGRTTGAGGAARGR